MNNFIENELVLVTGASSGIGASTILKLNSQAVRCVGIARREDKLIELKQKCSNPDLFHYEVRDLSKNIENLSEMITELVTKYGKFSGFVHSAGVLNLMTISGWNYQEVIRDFNINLFSAIELIKGLAKK